MIMWSTKDLNMSADPTHADGDVSQLWDSEKSDGDQTQLT